MKIALLTIFPDIFSGFLATSLVKKGCDKGLLEIRTFNIRDYADAPHYSTDDIPYGGGAGMVMCAAPLARAVVAAQEWLPAGRVICMTPAGVPFTQGRAQALSKMSELIIVCGRYEGFDDRFLELYVDEEISIGDYVLMGGEVPAMVVIEATTRLVSAVIGNQGSLLHESFTPQADGPLLLEAPHYTRPPVFEGHSVPEVLVSGDHAKIAAWRESQAQQRTHLRRPDLLSPKPEEPHDH